jgi:CheY-like chemotaxis protein
VKTILLIDDELAVLQMMATILRIAGGCSVLEARTLEEATYHLEKSGIDLVIADVCIDGRSPAAVASHLRTYGPRSRVLFVSGYPEEHLLPDGFLGQGAAFLAKPFSPGTLLRRMRELMSADNAPAQALPAIA